MIVDTMQPWIIFLTSTLALMLSLYAVAPKAWRTVGWFNDRIEWLHDWLKHNVWIVDVYEQFEAVDDRLENLDKRVSALETAGKREGAQA